MSVLTSLLERKNSLRQEKLNEPVSNARTVGEIFSLLEQRDFELSDKILHSLLQRCNEDPQASEIILYAMLPALTSLSKTFRKASKATSDEALLNAVECLYEAIQSPSLQAKETKVAARIKGSVLTLLLSQANKIQEISVVTDQLEENPVGLNGYSADFSSSVHSTLDLLEALAWARSYEVITENEAKFLLAIYSPELAGKLKTELNIASLKSATIRKRASRLVQKIACAVMEKELDLSEATISIY